MVLYKSIIIFFKYPHALKILGLKKEKKAGMATYRSRLLPEKSHGKGSN